MGRVALAFLLGHCCIHCLARLPDVALVPSVCSPRRSRWRSSGDSSSVAALLAGLGWAWLQRRRAHGRRSAAGAGRAGSARARLRRIVPARRGRRFAIPARRRRAARRRLAADPPRRGIGAAHAPQAGELWQLVVRLKRRNGFANPGGYDHEAQLFREGIGATGYVRDDARNARLAPPSLRYAVTRARGWVSGRIREAVRDRADARRSAGPRGRRHAGDDVRSSGACSPRPARRT